MCAEGRGQGEPAGRYPTHGVGRSAVPCRTPVEQCCGTTDGQIGDLLTRSGSPARCLSSRTASKP